MPPRGTSGGNFPPGATREERVLATVLQELRQYIPGTEADIGRQLHISASQVNHFLHARRTPDEAVLRGIHALAAAAREPDELPLTVEALVGLRRVARGEWCQRCGGMQGGPIGEVDRRNSSTAGSAAQVDRRNIPDASAAAPVPPSSAEGMLGQLDRQDPSTRVTVLWAFGGELSAAEAASALCDLNRAGRTDEVEILLASMTAHGRDLVDVIREVLAAR